MLCGSNSTVQKSSVYNSSLPAQWKFLPTATSAAAFDGLAAVIVPKNSPAFHLVRVTRSCAVNNVMVLHNNHAKRLIAKDRPWLYQRRCYSCEIDVIWFRLPGAEFSTLGWTESGVALVASSPGGNRFERLILR